MERSQTAIRREILFHIGTGYVGESFYVGVAYQNSYSYFGAPGYAMPKMPEHLHGNKPQEKNRLSSD